MHQLALTSRARAGSDNAHCAPHQLALVPEARASFRVTLCVALHNAVHQLALASRAKAASDAAHCVLS